MITEKFLTCVNFHPKSELNLLHIYTFVLVPRHLHEHSYASVSVRKNCFHMRTNIHMFVHIAQIAIRRFDSFSKNRFQSEHHERRAKWRNKWRGEYVIGTLVIRLAIRLATHANV